MTPNFAKQVRRSGTQLAGHERKGAGARLGGMPSLEAAAHRHAK